MIIELPDAEAAILILIVVSASPFTSIAPAADPLTPAASMSKTAVASLPPLPSSWTESLGPEDAWGLVELWVWLWGKGLGQFVSALEVPGPRLREEMLGMEGRGEVVVAVLGTKRWGPKNGG